MSIMSGQMKVVIITNYWKESAGGGVKTYLTNLVDEFDKRDDLEVSVLFREGQDHENHQIEGNKVLFAIKSFLKLKEFRPEVIHSQGTWYCLLPGYVHKKLYGTRLIHTFHTQPTKKLSYIGTMFIQSLLNGCDCTTVVSKSLRIDIEKYYSLKLKKTAITYAGVSSRTVSQEETKAFCNKFDIDDSNFVLLAQGFMSNEFKAKGAKILIKAVKCLSCQNPHIILILTGDGLYSNDLKKFAETEGMSDNVIFTENLSNPYIPLKICNIYTHITLADGLPLSLLEAMVMGKPIIAANIGGIHEAINDGVNGILVEPCEEQVIKKIEYLIANPNLARKLGDNAKETAISKYTWKKSANTFECIYNGDHHLIDF